MHFRRLSILPLIVLLAAAGLIAPSPLPLAGLAQAQEIVPIPPVSTGPDTIASFTPDTSLTTSAIVGPTGVAPLQGIKQVAVGAYHTCAVMSAGGALCWGLNAYGELGDGTQKGRSMPVDVSGLGAGVASIAAGGATLTSHSCAVTAAGGAKCWGKNYYGQLGDGTTTGRLTPVDVSGLGAGVAAISTSGYHACAVTAAGGVKCWGLNSHGQLGDATQLDRSTPVDVGGLGASVAAISAGGAHTCALTAAGGVKCWGYNQYGQLGDGTTTERWTPVDVSGLSAGVATISAGAYHTCAVTTAGGVKCWGDNGWGQLGDGTTTRHLTPVDASGLSAGVAATSAGEDYTCALTTAGGVKCWGRNQDGQLGDGTTTKRPTPVDVSGLSAGVAAISAGGQSVAHTCALTTAGGIKCWGNNSGVQLGDGTATGRLVPVDVMAGCYTLTSTHDGNGDDPVPAPAGSSACPVGGYAAGQRLTLTASPAAGWHVTGWSGTDDDQSKRATNTLTMPARDASAGVAYRLWTFLPAVIRIPPRPYSAPVLSEISNPNGERTFTVSWSSVDRATDYVLEEDDTPDFSSPVTKYSNAGTSTSVTVEAVGTYYYRVRAGNVSGSGPWSNTVSVIVTQKAVVPLPGSWSGYNVRFTVSSDSSEITEFVYSGIYVSGCGTYSITVKNLTITEGSFSSGGASGRFTTPTRAEGNAAWFFQNCKGSWTLGSASWTATR